MPSEVRGGAGVARQPHKLKVAGSSPAPAPNSLPATPLNNAQLSLVFFQMKTLDPAFLLLALGYLALVFWPRFPDDFS